MPGKKPKERQRYMLRINDTLVEVTREVYLAWYQAGRKERYQVEKMQRHGVCSMEELQEKGYDCSFSVVSPEEIVKDTVENREEQVEKITEDILNKDTAGLKNWLIEVSEESDIDSDVVTARSLLSRLENAETLSVFTRQPEQEQPEATITFYVAECMEFPVMGEYHENLTLEEALRIYETIPADRMNGIKGVGFELHDGSDYDGPYDLMRLGKVDREEVDMIQHYKKSPLVQKAMDDVEKYFAQKQELTKIAEKPVQKENVPQPKSRKESVLQALRERQAKIKEQEQNTSKEKSNAHKKGDVTL